MTFGRSGVTKAVSAALFVSLDDVPFFSSPMIEANNYTQDK